MALMDTPIRKASRSQSLTMLVPGRAEALYANSSMLGLSTARSTTILTARRPYSRTSQWKKTAPRYAAIRVESISA